MDSNEDTAVLIKKNHRQVHPCEAFLSVMLVCWKVHIWKKKPLIFLIFFSGHKLGRLLQVLCLLVTATAKQLDFIMAVLMQY